MEPKTVIVEERIGKGTRGGHYVYVLEGKELVHISDYAVRKLPGKYEDEIKYEIPINSVAGKILYYFHFTRSGNVSIGKCRIENFKDGLLNIEKCEYYEPIKYHINEIRDLKFRVKNPKLMFFLSQFEQVFIPMINDVQSYEKTLNFEVKFMGHERRLKTAFKTPHIYYFEFMILPNDKSRINSLKVTRRWIYQIWVLKLLCEAFQVSKFKGNIFEGKPFWWIEQGSGISTTIGETPFGDLTFWLEFQRGVDAHMIGMFTEERIPVRPDIVVVKGYFERTGEFVNSKKPIDLIVECKEEPFDEWEGEIRSQIIPYQESFKPHNFIVASLEHIPDSAKKMLENRGINVVDNLRPGSESIRTLSELVKKILP
jgi:hypothetical protein